MTLAQIKADQAWVFQDFPTEVITIAGVNYDCLIIDLSEGNQFAEGGLVSEATVRAAIGRDTMTAIPAEGTLATLNGTSYRIARVERDDLAASITIDLTDVDVT